MHHICDFVTRRRNSWVDPYKLTKNETIEHTVEEETNDRTAMETGLQRRHGNYNAKRGSMTHSQL